MCKLNKKVLLITILFLISTLLCSCGNENEDEYGNQLTKPRENREDIFYNPIWIPTYSGENTIKTLYDMYLINIHTDFKLMEYDSDKNTITMSITASNDNESKVTITANAIIDDNEDIVERTDYNVTLDGIDGLENGTNWSESNLIIKLNEDYDTMFDNIDIVFDIKSSCGKHITTTPCRLTKFGQDEHPRVFEAKTESGSDNWLDNDRSKVDPHVYFEETDEHLELTEEELERLEKHEQEREQEIEETRLNELESKGKMEVGNDKLGYLELQDAFVEISNEDDKIVYENNDEFGNCVVSIYTDSLDMSGMYPVSDYGSNLCQRFIDAGGTIESESFHLAEYKKQSIGLLTTIAENASEDTPLIFIGFLVNPYDDSKVIVVECDFSVNSQYNRDLGYEIFSSYRNNFYSINQ